MSSRERPKPPGVPGGASRARGLALSGLLVLLMTGCASTSPGDSVAVPSPQGVAPPAADSSVPAVPAASGTVTAASAGSGASSANANDATLTPAERQAREKQAALKADQAAQQALQQQCSDLRAEIREQQLDEQQAPNSSISEEIVQAKEAHADQRIQDLQNRYDSLDCPTVVGPPSHTPLVPVSPAASGLNPPGAQGVPSVP